MDQKSVLIAIQAKSRSTGMEEKCLQILGDRRVLDHVIQAAKDAADYYRHTYRDGPAVRAALLIPFSDKIASLFHHQCEVIEGPDQDVLSRFKTACDKTGCDFIVRISGDCPQIPPFVIAKMINLAVKNRYDYISNIDGSARTAIDGIDCEVFSRRMINWLDSSLSDPQARIDITSEVINGRPPDWAATGTALGFFDHSDIKLSIDTVEDLNRVRNSYEKMRYKLAMAEGRYGKRNVHRF